MNRTDRRYAIVEELRAVAPEHRSARAMAEQFEVSTRTIDATCATIRDLGGSVLVGPETTSFGLRFANVTDPSGNHFGIFTPPGE